MSVSEASAALEERATAAGFEATRGTVADRDALVARRSDFRWAWMATRMHTFVVAFEVSDLDRKTAANLSKAAQRYAIAHKGGLPRGLQTGSAAVAVFLIEVASPDVRSWFTERPKHRFGAMQFPVLLETAAGAITYCTDRMTTGGVYAGYLRDVAEHVVRPAAPGA
jgi:hypothetical protein